MSVQMQEENGGRVLEVHASGKLSKEKLRYLGP